MSNDPAPNVRKSCLVVLTIRHVTQACPEFQNTRNTVSIPDRPEGALNGDDREPPDVPD
ncbi:Hypothetical protein CINCED_3A001460 [Cinara cedri]|uniref:Uncharacterized protein n=1 Tax=Cinara cedri TaxID=506608 RepID=A0A5E4N1Q6_9HEMI|nr:Hypothetical protein CINCED_3A001460 [Cinara cedri]